MKNDYLQLRVLPLDPDVYATGQLFETDLKLIAAQGVRTLVNNRPDGEVPGQPRNADLETAARELGMDYVYYPVVSGRMSETEIGEFSRLLHDLDKPLLLFCRSGARSTMLYEAATADSGG